MKIAVTYENGKEGHSDPHGAFLRLLRLTLPKPEQRLSEGRCLKIVSST